MIRKTTRHHSSPVRRSANGTKAAAGRRLTADLPDAKISAPMPQTPGPIPVPKRARERKSSGEK